MGAVFAGVATVGVGVAAAWSLAFGFAHAPALKYIAGGLMIWVPIGFVAGLLFATTLTLSERWRSDQRLSTTRAALLGALGVPLALVPLIHPGSDMQVFLELIGALSVVGAGAAASIVTLAKRASPPMLPRGDEGSWDKLP